MRSRDENGGNLVARDDGPQGQAVRDPLRQRHHVGHDVEPVGREERTGPSHPGLYLVRDEEDPLPATEGFRLLQVAGRVHPHPAFPLDRLDEERADPVRQRLVERVDVADGDRGEPREHRLEPLVELRLRRGGEPAVGAAVERSLQHDDPVPALPVAIEGPPAGQLDRRLVRLRPAVAEEDLPPGRSVGQALPQSGLDGNVEQVGDVHEAPRLLRDRARDRRVGVPQDRHGDPAEEIEVRLAEIVVQPAPLAADEGHGEAGVVPHLVPLRQRDRLRAGHSAPAPRPARTISVPIPASVKISRRTLWGTRPSRIWTFRTPAAQRRQPALHLRDHPSRDRARPDGGFRLRPGHRGDAPALRVQDARHVGEQDELLRGDGGGDGGGGRVAVDVVRLAPLPRPDRGDDRDEAVGLEGPQHLRAHFLHVSHQAQVERFAGFPALRRRSSTRGSARRPCRRGRPPSRRRC